MPEHWINDLQPRIAAWLGDPLAALFGQYPVPSLIGAALLGLLGVWLTWRVLRGIARGIQRGVWRRWDNLTLHLALLGSRRGRACLRAARTIRNSNHRLRGLIESEIHDAGEREELFALMHGFARRDLDGVLRQARVLIARSDDRREARLAASLQAQQAQWNRAPDDASRGALQVQIAATREQLARLEGIHTERNGLVRGLDEAAATVLELETRLAELGAVRNASVRNFQGNLARISQEIQHLRSAHKALEQED